MVPGVSVRNMQRLKRIERADPELYKKVVKKEMTIGGAEAELKQRKFEKEHGRDAAEARRVAAEAQSKAPTKTSNPAPAPKGKPVPTPSTSTPEEKTARDERAFNSVFKPALAIFEEATSQARKNIVRKLASDLGPGTEIRFGGVTYKAPPPSLTGNGASEEARPDVA